MELKNIPMDEDEMLQDAPNRRRRGGQSAADNQGTPGPNAGGAGGGTEGGEAGAGGGGDLSIRDDDYDLGMGGGGMGMGGGGFGGGGFFNIPPEQVKPKANNVDAANPADAPKLDNSAVKNLKKKRNK